MMRNLVRYAAFVVVPRGERRTTVRRYINEYSCWPPPLFIPLISVIEVRVHVYQRISSILEKETMITVM